MGGSQKEKDSSIYLKNKTKNENVFFLFFLFFHRQQRPQ